MTGIGTLRETDLHAALKRLYAEPGDVLEARVDGYVIDLLRGELAIEFQTHNFHAIRRKLAGRSPGSPSPPSSLSDPIANSTGLLISAW